MGGKATKGKTQKNKTSFKGGNKAAEKWTLEEAIDVFEAILEKARKKTCKWYSIQEAVLESRNLIPYSTFYYLLDKFPVLEKYKKELGGIIIAKVNKGALMGDLVSTPAIWRMKQLGEKDKIEVDSSNTNINTEIELTEEQRKEALDKIKKGLSELNDY